MHAAFTVLVKTLDVIDYSLSLRFNCHFPGSPGLAGIIEAKDDGGGGDSWSYWSCKAPVKSLPPTKQHQVFLQVGCPSCHPTNSVKALKGEIVTMCVCVCNVQVFFSSAQGGSASYVYFLHLNRSGLQNW